MNSRNIIVIGASAGGFEAMKTLVAGLPADLKASVFIVWHMSAEVRGILPAVFNRMSNLPASHPFDGEEIEDGRIYVAPPDHHMLIEERNIRVTKGPKENRFRPAIDPLFRSAAHYYGTNVIGVILSGALDDGTSGLWMIKRRGGIAIVQDPEDAEVPSMPEHAIREVDVDFQLPVDDMAETIVRLVEHKGQQPRADITVDDNEAAQLKIEIDVATERSALEMGIMKFGELSPYTCPECHGALAKLKEGNRIRRFRCHTGHAFTLDSLLASVTEKIEDSLWNAIRGVEESILLLNHMGDHFAELNEPGPAALFFRQARDSTRRNDLLREALLSRERLTEESVRRQNVEDAEVTDQAESGVGIAAVAD